MQSPDGDEFVEEPVRACENSPSNITARLPDEVLDQIFLWNLSMQRDDFCHPWALVAAVCKDWRRIALACPRLWNRCVDPSKPGYSVSLENDWLTQVIIPRSKEVPLDLTLCLAMEEESPRWQALDANAYRIRELCMTIIPIQYSEENFSKCFTRAMPLLESFKLSSNTYHPVVYLSDDIFNGTAPRLRKLELSDYLVPPNAGVLAGITSLNLNGFYWQEDSSFGLIIFFLQATPNLEELSVSLCCPFPEDDLTFEAAVTLPRLKEFAIVPVQSQQCDILLSCITHPATTHVKLSFDFVFQEFDIVSGDVLLDDVASVMTNRTVASLTIQTMSPSKGVSLLVHGHEKVMDGKPKPQNIELTLNAVDSRRDDQHLLELLFDALPLYRLEILTISPEPLLDHIFMCKELATLPFLHTITITRRPWAIEHLIMALVPLPDSRLLFFDLLLAWFDKRGPSVIEPENVYDVRDKLLEGEEACPNWTILDFRPFPSLKFLRFESCTFRRTFRPYCEITMLATALYLRRILRIPLEELTLEDCLYCGDLSIANQYIPVLRYSVESIRWDFRSKRRGHG